MNGSAAALLEKRKRPRDVLNLEHDASHAVRVFLQVSVRASTDSLRSGTDDAARASLEHECPLATAFDKLLAAPPDLGKIELVGIEVPAALEGSNVVVNRLDAADTVVWQSAPPILSS